MEISLRLNNSHLDKLMKIPSGGPRSSIMESARRTACLGQPAPHHPSTMPEGEMKAVIICIDGVNDLVQNQSEKQRA